MITYRQLTTCLLIMIIGVIILKQDCYLFFLFVNIRYSFKLLNYKNNLKKGSYKMVSKKILALVLSAAIVSSGAAVKSVKAESLNEIDVIYTNAYNATIVAMENKSQKSINDAREAIKAIPLDLDWAIGEFSKQVDYIQQPIFEKAYNAIVTAQNEPTQININAAKAAIDPDMPDFYRSSYSSAVDIVQQENMKNAVDAFNKAVQSNLQEDKDAADVLFADIKKSTDPAIVEWVDLVQAKGDIIVAPTITALGVPSEITVEAAATENESGQVTDFSEEGKTKLAVALVKGTEDYTNVRVVLKAADGSAELSGIQLIAKDSENNYYNIVKTGWGPLEGFELQDASTDVYVVANAAGTYKAAIELVDVSSNTVIATSDVITVEATEIVAPTITALGLPSEITIEAAATENESGQVTDFSEEGKTKLAVALVKGTEDYTNVRVVLKAEDGSAELSGIQLIAKDSENNYYNIVKTGWGPLEGFALQNASTDVYVVANSTGTYKAVIELVDVSSNTVIATSDVITVQAAE
jgi:hypothetical protein